MKEVKFKHKNWEVAAILQFPKDFDETKTYAAVVCAHPISSCKNQTSGNIYGKALAEAGFITLAFDASHQGESGGEPRFLEDPATRIEDFRCAADYLTTLPYVNNERIGVLGVCGGGGYAANVAMTERRFKAVVTVAGANYGRLMREGDFAPGAAIRTLEAVAAQRTAEANGAEAFLTTYMPVDEEARKQAGLNDIDVVEAVDYYTTPRGQHACSPNKLLFSGLAAAVGFDAYHLAEHLLTQPLHIVIGEKPGAFGSHRDGFALFSKAASAKKSLQVVPGASHYDLYDQPEATGKALEQIVPFFREHLA